MFPHGPTLLCLSFLSSFIPFLSISFSLVYPPLFHSGTFSSITLYFCNIPLPAFHFCPYIPFYFCPFKSSLPPSPFFPFPSIIHSFLSLPFPILFFPFIPHYCNSLPLPFPILPFVLHYIFPSASIPQTSLPFQSVFFISLLIHIHTLTSKFPPQSKKRAL